MALSNKLHFDVASQYRHYLEELVAQFRWSKYVKILVVVDDGIGYTPGKNFGVGTVIDHVRSSKVGCMRFSIDIALRNDESPTIVNSPADFEPKYRGFRFDMEDSDDNPIINQYNQVWCFGLTPNTASTNDAIIDNPDNLPASDSELHVLSQWMDNRKGGLFGTGDHHILGASMCRNIPRLGTMRRWTNADAVPPRTGPDRIDTLRPPSAAFEPGAPGGPQPLTNAFHQGDLAVQGIRWNPWKTFSSPLFHQKRPHPVLCHPSLGPINVMPDHAHEGLCVPTEEIDLERQYNFGHGDVDEYPDAVGGGQKPKPEIIATGSTLGDPPYNFGKNEQPYRAAFPMISVYDGHKAGVGRVATDSTWHHWMGMNIEEIKDVDNDDWKKISRYFVNLAVWLNPPGISTRCLYLSTLESHFQYAGLQEYIGVRENRVLGRHLRNSLIKQYGPCWVTQVVDDFIWEERPKPWEVIQQLSPNLNEGQFDPQMLQEFFLGEMVSQTREMAEEIKNLAFVAKEPKLSQIREPEEMMKQAKASTFKETYGVLTEQCKTLQALANAFG